MSIDEKEFQKMMDDIQDGYDNIILRSKTRKGLNEYERGFIDGVDETYKPMMKLLKIIQSQL